MSDKAIQDIAEALSMLRRAFVKHNIPVPDEIGYFDPAQGRKARVALSAAARPDLVMRDVQVMQPWKSETLHIVGFRVNT